MAVGVVALAADMDWAYPPNPQRGAQLDTVKQITISGSNRQYTEAQINDRFNPPDWFPEEHPPMPRVVANGRPPSVFACALCHLPTGDGHPESSNLAGLPETYLVNQMYAFRSGDRRNARSTPMRTIAEAISDEEIKESARYFAALKPRAGYVKVAETDAVTASYVAAGGMRLTKPGGTQEPIGNRIIVLPQNPETVELRDPRAGFIDHVPPGSIKRGEELATTAGGKTTPCLVCHGRDLKGLADIPGIAGREATYLFRQMKDIRERNRKGGMAVLMAGIVEPLSDDDLIALAAYAASREP
jgi:cytochrome c553